MTHSPVRLIVGLGNPGDEYAYTRHNAGAWFVQTLARYHQISFRPETKLKSSLAHFLTPDLLKIFLVIPSTFMNHSGQAVKSVADFYDIPPESILIAHDELDIPTGDIRLKFAGGHGGHNGLRDIIGHLHSHDFYRLRIGISHPQVRELVSDYVLGRPSKSEKTLIDQGFSRVLDHRIIEPLLEGRTAEAMQLLNTKIDTSQK